MFIEEFVDITKDSLIPSSIYSNCIVFNSQVLRETVNNNFYFNLLNKSNLDSILELQNIIFDDLNLKGKSKFLYRKSEEDFLKLLNSKDSFVLGYFDNNKLIGQIIIKHLTHDEEKEGCDYYISKENKSKIGIDGSFRFSVGGMMIHPDYRGHKMAQKLINEAENILSKKFQMNDIALLAISSTENPGSYLSFLSDGYSIISSFKSLEDGDNDYLLYKPINIKLNEIKGNNFNLSNESLNEGEAIIRNKNKQFIKVKLESLNVRNRTSGISIDSL